MAKGVTHVITGTHSLSIIFTGNYWRGSKPGLGANFGNALLIGVCKLSSNVASFKFLSNNLIRVIKETFPEQLSDCWLVTLSFMGQTFALFSFPDMLCVSPATNLAPLLNMVFNSASHFIPAQSPQDWSSSTFQTAFLRLSITCGTGNLKKRQYTKACVFVPESGAQSAASPSGWVKEARQKRKNSPRSGVFLNARGEHFWWNSWPESSPWHAAEFLPEPLWVRTHLQGQQSK